ncbi:hypothetical protein [Actinophytocola algeriensis]|uniref:Uncharacterized protein n=1 Tax=Actinophytocola algeriensis TaxID=1768010 RepID=A0A7W7Q363_9PSEU|nr:hypothetical protein [Actinophytocola algeriensis]MBB4905936.1 hypothetical protein [Actinophytocola algeriensis]MBE1472379.1 hypothetical protein [Actinophytocola algeriensis]
MTALNTLVNGSPGTCTATADWLRKLSLMATEAANGANSARNTALSGWTGPAAGVFVNEVAAPRDDCDDLAFTCHTYEQALRDFASALESIGRTMDGAMTTAADGGLEVAGTFIHSPDRAAMIGEAPAKPAAATSDTLQKYNAAIASFNAKVDAYNAKAAVFNACSEIVKQARIAEDEAHGALRATFGAPGQGSGEAWKIGSVAAKEVAAFGEGVDDKDGRFETARARDAALKEANRWDEKTQLFTDWANGERYQEFTTAQRATLRAAAEHAGSLRNEALGRVAQYEEFLTDPAYRATREWVKTAAAGQHGKATEHPGAHKARATFRRLPYLGAGLGIGNELYGALKGEQTLYAAGAKIGADVATGKATSAVLTRVAPRISGVVGGLIGLGVSVAASLGMEVVVETFMPDHYKPEYNQPKVEMADRLHPGSPLTPPQPTGGTPAPGGSPGPAPQR